MSGKETLTDRLKHVAPQPLIVTWDWIMKNNKLNRATICCNQSYILPPMLWIHKDSLKLNNLVRKNNENNIPDEAASIANNALKQSYINYLDLITSHMKIIYSPQSQQVYSVNSLLPQINIIK